jgi:hypothetical protein
MYTVRLKQLEEDGEYLTISKGAAYMLHYLKTGERLDYSQFVKEKINTPYSIILAQIWNHVSGDNKQEMYVKDLYVRLCNLYGMESKTLMDDLPEIRVFYLQMISTMLFEHA